MKPLRQAIDNYITLRRSLGFKLRDMADELQDFATFLEQKRAPYVTTELAMEWAMLPADHQPSDWAQRLSFVRVLARHWHATDPRTEIPPTVYKDDMKQRGILEPLPKNQKGRIAVGGIRPKLKSTER